MLIQLIGFAAASLTTLCWLPQAVKLIRTCETRAISLVTQIVFVTGVGLWLIYGLMLADLPLIAANGVSLVLAGVILALKIRYG
jgi:MtN3 and saliva related transmembrane protein